MKKTSSLVVSALSIFLLLACSMLQVADGVLGSEVSTPTPQPTETNTLSPTDTALPPTSTPKPTNTP